MSRKIVIAIDGFSSCGKSTVAKQLARELGYVYVDSGAMYRAVTWYFLQNKVDLDDQKAIEQALKAIDISFLLNSDNLPEVLLNGQNVEKYIRSMDVSSHVSPVSTIKAVRQAMVKQQQLIGEKKGIVMDGRDIGTTVFPNAELKIFLTSNPVIRAKRRHEEYVHKGESITFDEVLHNLAERDRIDSSRTESPLRKADDAIEVDNSLLTREEQLHLLLALYYMTINENFSIGRKQLEVEKYVGKYGFEIDFKKLVQL